MKKYNYMKLLKYTNSIKKHMNWEDTFFTKEIYVATT